MKALPEASLILLNVQNFSRLGVPEGAEIMPSTWIAQEEKERADEALKDAVVTRGEGTRYVSRVERGGVAVAVPRTHLRRILEKFFCPVQKA